MAKVLGKTPTIEDIITEVVANNADMATKWRI